MQARGRLEPGARGQPYRSHCATVHALAVRSPPVAASHSSWPGSRRPSTRARPGACAPRGSARWAPSTGSTARHPTHPTGQHPGPARPPPTPTHAAFADTSASRPSMAHPLENRVHHLTGTTPAARTTRHHTGNPTSRNRACWTEGQQESHTHNPARSLQLGPAVMPTLVHGFRLSLGGASRSPARSARGRSLCAMWPALARAAADRRWRSGRYRRPRSSRARMPAEPLCRNRSW